MFVRAWLGAPIPTEHEPRVPKAFTPINGQKIAIVGYSHHREPQHEDRPDFTKWIVQRVIDGEQNGDSFFGPVSRYFGYDNKADFWSGVLFFNFLPGCIGVTEETYHDGTPGPITRAKAPLLRIHQPNTPATREQERSLSPDRLTTRWTVCPRAEPHRFAAVSWNKFPIAA